MIVRTRGGGSLELRAADLSGFGAQAATIPAPGFGAMSVSPSGVPAYGRAVRIACEQVAGLTLGVFRGRGAQREPVSTVWQARLFNRPRMNPAQTTYAFWETVQESIEVRGNAYVWTNVDRATGRAVELWALHPDQVRPRWEGDGIRYTVGTRWGYVDPVGSGPAVYEVDSSTLLHIRGHGDGGALRAPSPVERYRMSLAAAAAKITYEANLFNRGTSARLALTLPQLVDKQQLRDWRDQWKVDYEGSGNAGSTAVLPPGTVITPISLSQSDAQFVESVGMSVADCARIVGVPLSLLDPVGSGGAASRPITPEHEQQRLLSYTVTPRLQRLESAFGACPQLFPPGASVYPMFEVDDVLRGDLLTMDAIDHQRIQDGRELVDEWRNRHGLGDLPGGMGKVPQIVPVGGAPNPAAVAPAAPGQPNQNQE